MIFCLFQKSVTIYNLHALLARERKFLDKKFKKKNIIYEYSLFFLKGILIVPGLAVQNSLCDSHMEHISKTPENSYYLSKIRLIDVSETLVRSSRLGC